MFSINILRKNAMEDNSKLIESLFEKAVDYSKTSITLFKLRTIEKSSEFVSLMVPYLIVVGFALSFMLFLNLGLAFWLGEILGQTCFGFIIIAGFYGVAGIFIRLFLYKWLKKLVRNQFINQVLK
jgi:hypothetical protein